MLNRIVQCKIINKPLTDRRTERLETLRERVILLVAFVRLIWTWVCSIVKAYKFKLNYICTFSENKFTADVNVNNVSVWRYCKQFVGCTEKNCGWFINEWWGSCDHLTSISSIAYLLMNPFWSYRHKWRQQFTLLKSVRYARNSRKIDGTISDE